jgi:hypothetical protein
MARNVWTRWPNGHLNESKKRFDFHSLGLHHKYVHLDSLVSKKRDLARVNKTTKLLDTGMCKQLLETTNQPNF